MDRHKQHDQGQNPEKEQSQQKNQDSGQKEGSDPLENLVSLVSGLLLLGAMAFLVWEGLSTTEPPRFEAEMGVMWSADGSYYLPLEVRNTGGESVQNLGLSVMLKEGDKTISQAETAIAWLPAHSHRRAGVIFDKDPKKYQILTAFKGYESP